MFNLATMAFRGIRRRRTRNLMLALAVVLGVMLTVGIDLSFKSVYGQLDEIMVEAAGSIDIMVRRSRPPFKVSELQPIRNIPGVLAVSPRVVQTMPIYTDGYDGDAYIVGVTPNDFEFQDPIYTNIQGGRDLTGKKVCVVDERIGDPEIGRFLHIYTYNDTKHGTKRTDYTYTITGILSPREISISTRDLYSVYLDIDAARFIFNKAERDLPYIYKDYHVDYAIVKIAIIQEGPKIAEEIIRALGPEFTAIPLKEPLLNRYRDTLAGLRNGLNLTQKLSLILIAAVTFNTGFIGIEERAHEIGVLRAVGASPFQVFWILFLETFTVSLLASLTGAIAGIAFGSLLLQYIFGPLLNVRMSLYINALPLLSGLQIGIIASALGGILPAINAGKGKIASFLATGLPPSERNGSGILLLGTTLIGIGLSPLIPVSPQPVTQILGGEVGPLLSAASLTMGLSCVIGYVIQQGGQTIGTILSLLFYKIGAITGRNMGRKSKRTVMCLLLLSTSMSFLITMSGIETNLTNGIENSLGGFLGADLIVVSDNNFEKELAEKIFNLRNQVDVEIATPVYTGRQTLYKSGDYRRYNIEGSLMLMENDFFETANIKFSTDTPKNIIPLLYSQLRVCITTRSLAGTLNIQVGDHVAIKVAETHYDDLGNEYTEEVLEKLRVIGIAETTSFQYFTVGGAPLDKVCMTPYSNWGHLHPQFYFEDELVKEDNSEEQLLATVILIKTKPNANLEELKEAILDEFDGSYDIEKIVTREDLAEQYIGNVKAVFDAFKTAFYFSVGITVIGVSQVLFMNLRGRRREFGLLKAIGMSEIQLAMMVISEALFLSVAAFLIGYLGGFLTWRQIADIMGLGGFQIPMLLEREKITNLFAVSLATSLSSVIYPTFTLHRSTPNQLLYEKGD